MKQIIKALSAGTVILLTLIFFGIVSSAEVYELKTGDIIQTDPAKTIISDYDKTVYTVTSVNKYNLSDGITEYVVYTNDENHTHQTKLNIAVAKTSDGSAKIAAGYGNMNPKENGWCMVKAEDQVRIYEEYTGENVVACINASWFNVSTGEPSGVFVMDGKIMKDRAGWSFIASFDDGSINIFRQVGVEDAEKMQSELQGHPVKIVEAVDGFSDVFLWDGKCVMRNDRGYYPRAMVGITPEGDTVICQIESGVSDSAGYDVEMMAALMIRLGCVNALRLDEGGSATFCSKRAEDSENIMRNTSVQGTERNISGTLMLVDLTGLSEENRQTDCEKGDHKYTYDDSTGKITCPLCNNIHLNAKEDAFAGWAFDSTGDGEYFFVNGTKATYYTNLKGTPTYFDGNGVAVEGKYTIGGSDCYFERGIFKKSEKDDVLLAGWVGLEDKLFDVPFLIYKDGRMFLYGSGETGKFDSYSTLYPTVPWNKVEYRNQVVSVFVSKNIRGLNRGLFRAFGKLESLIFEEGSKTNVIGLQCLYYDSQLKAVSLPDGFKIIDTQAFAERPSLEKLYLPSTVSIIREKAFQNDKNLTLYVEKGTYGEQYAIENNIPYVYGKICENCGHTFDSGVKKDGLLVKTCTVCGITESEKPSPSVCELNGHKYDNGEEKDGYMVFTCTVCGDSYSEKLPEVVYGELDGNDEITVSDARIALRMAIGLDVFEENDIRYVAADVDDDKQVTVSDARLILRAAISLDVPQKTWKVYL